MIEKRLRRAGCPSSLLAPYLRGLSDFVPKKGLNDRSQAIYCLECVQRGDPSRRDGVIGSDRRATIRTINQLGWGSDRTLRDGFSIGRVPGNELPGYDHLVPSGQQTIGTCLLFRLRPTTKVLAPFRGRGRGRGIPRLLLSGSLFFRDGLLFHHGLINPFDIGHQCGVAGAWS
jgi:hypothetical protein